jgi:hypothetical protein
MLNLRVGDAVEVKNSEEILATLDSKGELEGLPFMPEMLKYCGQKYKVYKRADKTTHYINIIRYSCRRMFQTVHLEGLRCDGGYHGGCDTLCMLYWKEAWLKRAVMNSGRVTHDREEGVIGPEGLQRPRETECTIDTLLLSTKVPRDALNPDNERYSCQATEAVKATSDLKWWDFRQYYRDLHSGNISFKNFAKWSSVAILNWLNVRIRGYRIYPFIDNRLVQRTKTPDETLNLQVGDYVQIKTLDEILQTLDVNLRNKGLLFTKELIPYCGKTSKVIKIVKKTVNEVDGEMFNFSRNCIILEDVICTGLISDKRLFCQKSCYPFWREIWLKRIEQ